MGPFGAKNFATTISPWVVTFEALRPFLCAPLYPQDPKPLPYLRDTHAGNYNVALTVSLNKTTISNSNMKYLYWTFKQQLVHHTVTGCNMRPGDLLGSGTISGPQVCVFACTRVRCLVLTSHSRPSMGRCWSWRGRARSL